MGTARILSLSLTNSRCFVGEDFSLHSELNALLNEPDVAHWLLYPGEQAQPLSSVLTPGRPEKIRVILIDGTWKKAYKIWQLSTNLHSLPQLKLAETLTGNYRIRKAPSDNSLSTVEAGYHLLSELEPEQDFSPLMNAFEHMIQFQIDQMPPELYQRHYGSR